MARKTNAKTKTCTSCNKTKNIDEFYRDKSQKDGRTCWCKTCEGAYNKLYFATLKSLGVTRKIDITDEKTRAKFETKMRNARVNRAKNNDTKSRTNATRARKTTNA